MHNILYYRQFIKRILIYFAYFVQNKYFFIDVTICFSYIISMPIALRNVVPIKKDYKQHHLQIVLENSFITLNESQIVDTLE